MKAVISSPDDTLALNGLRPMNHGPLWITGDGISGWYGAQGAREQATDIPQQDGAYWPSRLTAGGRTVTINAAAVCMSGIQLAALRDRLNALACQPLTLTIEDAHGIRSADCWLADDTDPIPLPTEQAAAFTLVLYCPDPLKYGPPVTYPASGGVIRVRNEGNAPTWPSVAVSGHATSLRLTLGDGEVRWQGDADGLTLDFHDMIPSSGTIVHDLAFRIPPGASAVTATVDAGATVSMTVRPAWR